MGYGGLTGKLIVYQLYKIFMGWFKVEENPRHIKTNGIFTGNKSNVKQGFPPFIVKAVKNLPSSEIFL